MTLVAIHQPNFLPWLGYFDKIRRAQAFILLDDVQFQKTGATWTNRVQVLVAGAPAWLTVPVVRAFHGTRAISEIEIDDRSPWRDKLLRTVELNYRRAPHFDAVYTWIAPLIKNQVKSLVELNVQAIRAATAALGLENVLVLSSSVNVQSRATDRLVELVRAVGGDAYLAGGGAQGYQEDHLFREAGISLVYQEFEHPKYPQHGASQFVPGLSIVDAFMNCGFAGTAELLHQGRPA
ncbi:MAG TPA: WbqC family protein [Candidatus Sulfotelmatobacter sp.]|nr:WbqC family protein [Candidatus Sulfotelmatobacter sp.]